ncbi:hypothetical protein FHR86_003800 [Paenarthrobacter ilicis]|uniref:Uncharacterized protein n=1 Tax=Paenarthrobacter ilicis TaxID=43665 RepID=A0ABX0TQH8_9MICC|nr:hypothetical protein [Paenarthrobacter ilicis]
MGLRNFLNRSNPFSRGGSSSTAAPDATVAKDPLPTLEPSPGQLEDLESARAELLQLAAAVGLESLNACPRDGSRWQDDPATIRSITAVIREAQLEEQQFTEGASPSR